MPIINPTAALAALAVPTTTLTTNPSAPDGDNGWFKTVPSVTLTPNDTTAVTYFAWDGGAYSTYTVPFNPPEGIHSLSYYSVDSLGNSETVNNQAFKVDTGAPNNPVVTSPSHTVGGFSNDNTIEITWPEATDAAGGIGGCSFDWTLNATATPDTTMNSAQIDFNLPPIASGGNHTVGLKTDGTVVAVGDNWWDQTNVSSWTDIKAVAAGSQHTVGLKSDGTAVAVGDNYWGPTNVSSWTDIKAVAAGWSHTVGLKSDGTAVVVGYSGDGLTNVSSWSQIKGPTYAMTSPSLADGSWYFNLRTADNAGNWTTATHLGPFNIDTAAPTGVISINNAADYTNSTAVSLDLSGAGDPAPASGLDKIMLSEDASFTSASWQNYSPSVSFNLSASDGTKTVYAKFMDAAGNASGVVSDSIILDMTAPTQAVVTAQGSSTTTVDLSWTPSEDSASGLDRYAVLRSTSATGTYSEIATTTATSYTDANLSPGTDYFYKLVAYDGAGNSSTSAYAQAKTWTRYEETYAAFTYSNGWSAVSDSGYSGGAENRSKKKNSYVQMTFTGTGFNYIAAKTGDRGLANIYIDDVLQTQVDLYSANTQYRQVLYSRNDLTNATHTVKIEVVNGGDYVGIDAIEAP